MPHYDSDNSSVVDEDRRPRRQPRYSSPSEDSHYPRRPYSDHETPAPPQKESSKYGALGKVALLVGAIALFEIWQNKKSAEREREDRRQRRKDFERAKRKRRRDEERREREQELNEADEPMAEVREEVRKITYKPAGSRSRSRGRIDKGIESLSEEEDGGRASRSNSVGDEGYETNRASRSRARG